jgi:DNA-binding protein HU-beta
MNKSELVTAIAARANMTKTDADAAVRALVDVVTDTLAGGDGEVSIPGFVSFKRVQRDEREARNPATGEKITVPAGAAVKVSAGAKLKAAVK